MEGVGFLKQCIFNVNGILPIMSYCQSFCLDYCKSIVWSAATSLKINLN